MRTIPIILLFLFPSLFLSLADPTAVNLGVILDVDSPVGQICNVSIKLALADFYSSHPNSTTRIRLSLRHSPLDDVVSAASAAVDLVASDRVVAILGPQTSASATFVAELGSKFHVPVISFSATSPSLSPETSPFFIRAAVGDAASAAPIAALVQHFGWRRVVPINEDSDFGSSFVPYLVDALDAVGSQVPYRLSISRNANDDHILAELYRVKTMQTRVFVVHARPALAARIFTNAHEAEMMEEGFAWIVTDGAMTLYSGAVLDSMQGVLGVKPYINPRYEKLREFISRWRREFLMENPDSSIIDITNFGIWAYDAVTAVATAIEAVKSDPAATAATTDNLNLLEEIRKTEFKGLAGQFKLVKGELNVTAFQIINVVEEKGHGIGFWTPSKGLSMRLHAKKKKDSSLKLGPVVWPGDSQKLPIGFVSTTSERKLRIAVPGPVEAGFHSFLSMEINPLTKEVVASGFVIQVFEEAVKRLPYALPFEYVAYMKEDGKSAGSYDDLVKLVPGEYDAVVADVTIRYNRSEYVDFTLPYTESGVSMVVRSKAERNKNAWIFLKPLKRELCLVSLAFFIFTGFVVWALEHRVNEEFRGPPAHQIGTVFYFTFSTLVFAHKEAIVSNLARFVVIIWVFVVLILQSSYTANLTSMLTVGQIKPTITDISDLIENNENVGYLKNSFMKEHLINLGFKSSQLMPYKSPQQYAYALSKGSKNGGVAAVIDETPYLKVFLKDYCDDYTMVGPTGKTGGFGFVFPKGSSIVPDLSRAILNLTESDYMAEIEREWFGDDTTCTTEGSKLSSHNLNFRSFWGLFLITGTASMLALFIYLAPFLYKNWHIFNEVAPQNSIKNKVRSIAKIYDGKDLTSHTFKRGEFRNTAVASIGDPSASPSTYGGTPLVDLTGPVSPVSTSHNTDGVTPSDELDNPMVETSPITEITNSNE